MLENSTTLKKKFLEVKTGEHPCSLKIRPEESKGDMSYLPLSFKCFSKTMRIYVHMWGYIEKKHDKQMEQNIETDE